MNKLLETLNFAADKHRAQRRKDAEKTPYINHPIHVATLLSRAITEQPELKEELVKRYGGVVKDETDAVIDLYCVGLCHDLIEDTDTTLSDIDDVCGFSVAMDVSDCSDDKTLDKVTRKKEQIKHVDDVNVVVKLVKLADKYSNVSGLLENPPATWDYSEIVGYAIWAYAVYKKLKGVSKYFDTIFDELYQKKGFDHIPKLSDSEMEAELNKYYENIKNSE